jgi:hypothetical protein
MTESTLVLDELLSDPMIQMVMARDSVRPEELRRLLLRVRDRAEDPSLPPAYMLAEKTCQSGRICG